MNKQWSPDPPLKGVGGWLLILILMLAFYTPLTGGWSLYKEFILAPLQMPALESNPLWVKYRLLIWIIFGMVSLLCLVTGYALWRIHKPMTVQLAIGVIWLAGPFVPVISAAVASAIFDMNFSQAIKPFYIGIFSTAVQSAIWTGYLVKSVRVKNTYYP